MTNENDTCPECGAKLEIAPGIGPYCPVKGCKYKDGYRNDFFEAMKRKAKERREKQGTPAPMSREEWTQKIRELCWAHWNVGYSDNSRGYDPSKAGIDEDANEKEKAILTDIMALQAKVDELTEDQKWCRCIVHRWYEGEDCRNCGLQGRKTRTQQSGRGE